MSTIRRLAALAVIAVAACSDDAPTAPSIADVALATAPAAARQDLAAARAATARYHDVARATADGYKAMGECVPGPTGGAMGVHYVNERLLLDGKLEVERPEVLLYEPQKNGGAKLVGVEYMIPKPMWDPANPGKRPTMFAGTAFEDGPMNTYALHVWVWQPNPAGIFQPFNTAVSCPTSGGSTHGAHH